MTSVCTLTKTCLVLLALVEPFPAQVAPASLLCYLAIVAVGHLVPHAGSEPNALMESVLDYQRGRLANILNSAIRVFIATTVEAPQSVVFVQHRSESGQFALPRPNALLLAAA